MIINEHFYLEGDKMKNNCGYGCCMHCQYLLDDKKGRWKACNQSCLSSKQMIGKSCSICELSEYGKKL